VEWVELRPSYFRHLTSEVVLQVQVEQGAVLNYLKPMLLLESSLGWLNCCWFL